MSEHDCPITPARRAAYRDRQVREVLRRREAAQQLSTARVALAVATMKPPDDRARVPARRECPRRGKPHGKRARCYSRRPGGGLGSRS